MHTEDLKDSLLLRLLVTNDEQGMDESRIVMAAGPLSKQPGSNPYRIVLVDVGSQFVVWTQLWSDSYTQADGTFDPDPSRAYFEHGDYFQPDELVDAVVKWSKRVSEHAKFLQSIKRDSTNGDWVMKSATN